MAQVNEQNGKRDVKIRAALQQLGAAVQSSGTPEQLICSRGVGNSISPTDQMPLQAEWAFRITIDQEPSLPQISASRASRAHPFRYR